jgi:carnitine-CoA ligase
MLHTDDGFVPLLARRARGDLNRVFAQSCEGMLSFGDLDRLSSSLARWLRSQGCGPGDRIAVMLGNSFTSIALIFGLGKAGAVWVPINVRSRGENLGYILSRCAPRLIIAEHHLVEVIRGCGANFDETALWTLGNTGARRAFEAALAVRGEFDEPPPAAEDTFAIMYTSGTTGMPKGVLVSHRMLRLSGEGAALVSSVEDGDIPLLWEPIYHIGGAQMLVVPLIRNVHLGMIDRFSATGFWSEARALGASHMHYLGGILQMLLKQSPGPLDRTHGIRVAWGGGCPSDIWREFEDRFGVKIRECYGMTEASSFTTCNENGVVGSVGRSVPWLAVELCGAGGRPVPIGDRGEIVVREKALGALTRGYFKAPEATANSIRDGAFYTGDIGSLDADGNLYFHGRMTDSVRVRGENVSAFEVEHVAAKYPAVEDCAMIGVAADIGEQEIKLFVKARPGAAIDPSELSSWLQARLAPYQNPRYIEIIHDFERTPSQRIMKHKLSSCTDNAWDRMKADPSL